MPAVSTPPAALEALVVAAFGPGAFIVEAMPGGASTRRYFRITHGTEPRVQRAVAMFVPEGGKAEEIDKAGPLHRWPFLEVRDLLEGHGVDVPRLYGEDTAAGWLLLEDLGDETLANVLLRQPALREPLYRRAVRDLARAQATLEALPEGCVVQHRAFDEDLLYWELLHFREWGVEARGRAFCEAEGRRFDAIARRLAARIAGWPRAFTHRDYQSRNLMVRGAQGDDPSLVWIDFQDALRGPRAYDLVALLNDSYQTFTPAFVEARLDDYAEARGLTAAERAELGREFELVTVQRKLKDAGRFVYIDRVKGNASFLKFVLPTLEKARAALERLAPVEPDMADLLGLLERARVVE